MYKIIFFALLPLLYVYVNMCKQDRNWKGVIPALYGVLIVFYLAYCRG